MTERLKKLTLISAVIQLVITATFFLVVNFLPGRVPWMHGGWLDHSLNYSFTVFPFMVVTIVNFILAFTLARRAKWKIIIIIWLLLSWVYVVYRATPAAYFEIYSYANRQQSYNDSCGCTEAAPGKPGVYIKNDTQEWKLYENKDFGFSLSFPPRYTVEENVQYHAPVRIVSPKTAILLKENMDTSSDAIAIFPEDDTVNSNWPFPDPMEFTEAFFSKKAQGFRGNDYIGPITIDNHLGFQLHTKDSLQATEKYTIFKNSLLKDRTPKYQQTWFIVRGGSFNNGTYTEDVHIEPYDSILASLKFAK